MNFMEIDKKTFFPQALIFGLFTLAVLSLAFSGLSAGSAVSMQNGLIAVFLKSVQSSVVAALADSVFFILQNIVLPLLPFLLLSTLGFSAVLWFKTDTKKLAAALVASAACVLALSLVLNITPAILIISLGYFALLLPIEFEERKTSFRTGYAFVSYIFRYLNLAVAVAVFAAILAMPDFDKSAEQQMVSSINVLLPDIGQLQQAQNEVASSFITQASASVNNIVETNYAALPGSNQTYCSGFKDSINSGIDSYKSQLLSQLQSGNSSIGTEQLAQEVFSKVGVFSAIAKATPLIAALSLLALLELIKPLLALAGGAVYSLLDKRFVK